MFAQRVSNNFDPGLPQDGGPEQPPYPRYGRFSPDYITGQSGEDKSSCQQTAFSSQGFPMACSDVGFNCTDFDRWKKKEVLPTIVETRSITVEEFDRMSAGTRKRAVHGTSQEATLKGNFAFFQQSASRCGFDYGKTLTHDVSREIKRETTRNAALGLPYQSHEDRPSTPYVTNPGGQPCLPATGALHALCTAHKRFLQTWNDADTKNEGLCRSMLRPDNEEQHAAYVDKKVRATKRRSPVSEVRQNGAKTYQEKCASQVHSANDASSLAEKAQQQQGTAHDGQVNVTRDAKQDGGAGPAPSARLPPKKRRRLDDIVMRLKGSSY
ncbi:uncharacterized protein LOC144923955 [Branchiostoma floridae x Branchiostoma belcheri]